MENNKTNGVHTLNGLAKDNKIVQNGVSMKEQPKNGVNTASIEKPKPEAVKDAKSIIQPEQPKLDDKADILPVQQEVQATKPVFNLETKLKVVNELHRKSVQRINLLSRIHQLDAFEVALTQEHDELEENPYQGCKLIIEDDKRRQFITTTPGLIRLVSKFIDGACREKLAQIEVSIVFPSL